jgi:hypothetical protein
VNDPLLVRIAIRYYAFWHARQARTRIGGALGKPGQVADPLAPRTTGGRKTATIVGRLSDCEHASDGPPDKELFWNPTLAGLVSGLNGPRNRARPLNEHEGYALQGPKLDCDNFNLGVVESTTYTKRWFRNCVRRTASAAPASVA